MTEAFQFVALFAAAGFVLWAALVALATHPVAELPRVLMSTEAAEDGSLDAPRTFHVVHLALLLLAGAFAAYASQWWAWPAGGAWLRLVLIAGLVWMIGDLLPRLLAALAPEAVPFARPIARHSLIVFRPLMALVAFAERNRPRSQASTPPAADREMLHGVFALGEMSVAEVMTPRIDIVAVDLGATTAEVMDAFQRARHSRLLVEQEDHDAVIGVLYAKDCLASLTPDAAPELWRTLIRPAQFVPEGKTLKRQLRDFQRGPSHLMVVVDEFGGTAGLVTLEDIVEQIVGEIQDEYDQDEMVPIQVVAEGEWAVQGGVSLSELEAVLQTEFEREDVNTVGGLVLAELGRVARPGDTVQIGGYQLQVDLVSRHRVRRVVVREIVALPRAEDGGA